MAINKTYTLGHHHIILQSIEPLFSDNRGWLISAAGKEDREALMKQPRIISVAPGAIRGNHYHDEERETIVFLNSQWIAKFSDLSQTHIETVRFDASKQPMMLEVPPQLIHAFKNVSSEVGYIFHYSDIAYSDTRSKPVIILSLEL